jgi:hypothetical protein
MNTTVTMLQPVMVLVLWSLVIWMWMYATRIPAVRRAGMELDPFLRRGEQMAQLPAQVRWKADNYNNLMEQPTVFYATALVLAVLGDASTLSLVLAWSYVGIRIAHSLMQVLINKIIWRFALFFISSLVLIALAIRAAVMVFYPNIT